MPRRRGARRLDEGIEPGEVSVSPCSRDASCGQRGAKRARSPRASRPRSTCCARGAAAPTSRSSTSSRRRPRGAGTSSFARSCASSRVAGSRSRSGRSPGERPRASSTRSTSTSGGLRRFARRGARMVHRVDGPIGAYRGFDDGTDARIAEINAALASATIFQSEFSLAEAPRARLRAAGAGRHLERGRPGDLPSTDKPRSAGG